VEARANEGDSNKWYPTVGTGASRRQQQGDGLRCWATRGCHRLTGLIGGRLGRSEVSPALEGGHISRWAPRQAAGGGRVTGLVGGKLGHEGLLWGSGPHWRQVGQTGVVRELQASLEASHRVQSQEGKQAAVGWASGSSSGMCLIGGELDAGRGEWLVVGETWIAVLRGGSSKGLCEYLSSTWHMQSCANYLI
jgi:hypothetical protein